jgi:regulatory protein
MKSPMTPKEAEKHLMHLCSRSEKCLYDVKQKLKTWGLDASFEHISETLLKEKFIDELRYSRSVVNDKIRFAKWGRIKVRYNLRMKGIAENDISEAINNFSEDEYRAIIRKELLKKNKSIKEANPIKRKLKLMIFAKQRGYEPELFQAISKDFLHGE